MIAKQMVTETSKRKRPDLEDVIFSGGLIRSDNDRAILSVGVSDAEAYRIEIPDPFKEYE
jgi:hypothetical protein